MTQQQQIDDFLAKKTTALAALAQGWSPTAEAAFVTAQNAMDGIGHLVEEEWRDLSNAVSVAMHGGDRAPATPTPTAADLIARVKAEARRRILAMYPDWKQANMTARGVELTDKKAYGGSLTPDESQERDDLQAAWDWIKAIRSTSNALELAIAGMTEQQRAAFRVGLEANWS